jgi:hypothetical protein
MNDSRNELFNCLIWFVFKNKFFECKYSGKKEHLCTKLNISQTL